MANSKGRGATARVDRTASRGAISRFLRDPNSDRSVKAYLCAAQADSTRRAYESDLKHFRAWGGRIPASPEVVARYLAHHAANLSCATLTRRLAAIGHEHLERGLASPTATALVRATLRGIRRAKGSRVRQVAPLLKRDLLLMLKGATGLKGLRDRALLLVGFAAALRRSELVALDVGDAVFVEEGLIVRLRRSKTDQDGAGREIPVPRVGGRGCPVAALQRWLAAAAIEAGPLFRPINRHDQVASVRLAAQGVALIVKQRAAAAGFDPSRYSGHSLRAGFATNAAGVGASAMSIRAQTGHKSDAMLQRYIRHSQLFHDNPNARIR